VKTETLNGLELYQFLHSHGADEYGARVNSTYSDVSISDPLDLYTPVNSVHNTGNFRYDITQWNQRPFSTSTHVDYVGFSSAVEPDWVDNSYYEGGHDYYFYIPPRGTHLHIEGHNLNGETSIYTDEVGGAMGWSLGSLDPNETASLTVAFMFTVEKESPSLILTKMIEDPNDCYKPGDTFTYTIEWENISLEDAENAVLIDYLPDGVDYPGAYWRLDPNMVLIPPDPNYDAENHTYTWDIGTIAASGTGYRELTVTVDEQASSGMTIRNEAVLETSIGNAVARYTTDICCWEDSGVIYVDEDAAGANTGMNWNDAYTDLQDALARVRAGCWTSTEIRVARGVYDPGRIETTTFSIPDNTSVYGGYKGGTVDGNDRDPKKYRTVLAGDRDVDRNETIVTMGDETRLDGFTVTGAANYGVYGSGVDFTIENCSIEKRM